MADDQGESRRRHVRIETIGTIVVCLALLAGYTAWRATRPAAPPAPLLPIATADEAIDPNTAPAAQPTKALPDSIPRNRIAIRVVTPDGKPVSIASVSSIMVMIEPSMPWMMGPTPAVFDRFADGWVYVDKSMYALAKPGMQTDLVAMTDAGATASASAPYPNGQRIEYKLAGSLDELIGGASSVPADVKRDEIAGIVVDAAGKPIEGAKVSFPTDYPAEWKAQMSRPETTTDAAGIFRFPGFGRQHFIYMQVDKAGLATRRLTDVPIGKAFSVRLDDRTRLRGDLTRADGSSAANAVLTLVTNRPTARRQMGNTIRDLTSVITADERGHYDVPIEPGTYAIRIETPTGDVAYHPNITIKSGTTLALPAALGAGEALTLHVADSATGKPVAGAAVHIDERRPGVLMDRKGSERKADADGNATWEHLPAMPSTFTFTADGYERAWLATRPPQPYETNHVRIDLTPGNPTAQVMNVQMEPAVSVTGRLLAPDGSPVPHAMIDIGGLETGDSRYSKQTDAEGRFKVTFPVLPSRKVYSRPVAASGPSSEPDECAIVAFDPSGHWANALSEKFIPKPGEVRDITLKMTTGGRVTGRVVNMHGEAVPGIEVEATADDGMDRMYYSPRQITDAEGRYDLGPVRPATYEIRADTNFGVNMSQPPQTPVILTIAEGEMHADVTVSYDGPPPPPVPDNYFNYGGNRRVAK